MFGVLSVCVCVCLFVCLCFCVWAGFRVVLAQEHGLCGFPRIAIVQLSLLSELLVLQQKKPQSWEYASVLLAKP